MTLQEVKLYLRAGNDEDDLITGLIAAASSYIDRQTGKTQVKTGGTQELPIYGPISADALYILCNKLIIAHWYENRGVEIAGTMTKISHSVDALVNHIAMCGDYV